jgi:gliding motility-associated-like protein
MRTPALLFFCLITCIIPTFAQLTYKAPLDPGRISLLFNAVQAQNGDFLTANGVPGPNPVAGGNINITRIGTPDGIRWSKDYLFENPMNWGSVHEWPAQNALVLAGFTLDSSQNITLLKTDQSGNLLWSRRFGSNNNISPQNLGRSAAFPDTDVTILLAGGAASLANNTDPNDLFVARVIPNGQLIWAHNYCFSCLNGADVVFSAIRKTQDGNIVVAGTVQPDASGPGSKYALLLKLNPVDGALLWAKYYRSTNAFNKPDGWVIDLQERPNGNLVLSGYLENTAQNDQFGLVLETDPNGQLQRIQRIEILNADQFLSVNHTVPVGNTQLALSIGTIDKTQAGSPQELNILAQIDDANNIIWQFNHLTEPKEGYLTNIDAFFAKQGGGYAFFPNFAVFLDNLFPFIILTDAQGRNGCEEPVTLRVSTVSNYVAEDIAPLVQPLSQQADFGVMPQDFDGYSLDLPTLDLGPDSNFCAADTVLLNATVAGAGAYAWNTGDTTATINASPTGTYAVTVTDTERCLTLVDSVRLALTSVVPSAQIVQDTSGFCADSTLVLIALVSDTDSIRWSTGELNDTISVKKPGDYVLFAYNSCGFDTAMIKVTLPTCKTTCPYLFPNVFTPNDDTTNDAFGPVGKCPAVSKFTMQVYNRWGDLVFEGLNPDDTWDGEVNGLPAPADVYVWWARYQLPDQPEVIEKGNVTLLR